MEHTATDRAADRGGQQGQFALGPLCEGGPTTKNRFKMPGPLCYSFHLLLKFIRCIIPLPTCVQSRETMAAVLLPKFKFQINVHLVSRNHYAIVVSQNDGKTMNELKVKYFG